MNLVLEFSDDVELVDGIFADLFDEESCSVFAAKNDLNSHLAFLEDKSGHENTND